MVVDNFVWLRCLDGGLYLIHSGIDVLAINLNCLEVVVFCFVVVWQVPKYSNIFQTQVVPFVRIWIIGYFVVMHVLSLAPHASKFNQLSCVYLLRSTTFVSILSRNPSSMYYDS